MPKIAYIGPEYSFSHDLLNMEFPDDEHIACESLSDVVTDVAKQKVERGVVPFYNTTRMSIEETQFALIGYRNKVFVSNVLPLKVRHFLCGFGKLTDIRELRTKSVVYHQASAWLTKHLPSVNRGDVSSTSLAIKSLVSDGKPANVAAIGTRSAAEGYQVPVIRKDIQNKPNVTSFFVIQREEPAAEGMDHALMCIRNSDAKTQNKASEIVAACGCSISSNWLLSDNKKRTMYFFEIDGTFKKLDLRAAVARIVADVKNTHFVGGYADKCITRLIYGPQNSISR